MKSEILNIIYEKYPTQKKKIEDNFAAYPEMEKDLVTFLDFFSGYMKNQNITPAEIAEAYITMLDQMMFCRKEFISTGQYHTTSQIKAMADTYSNDVYMRNYMLALALSQFIWKHHYLIFNFYKEIIKSLSDDDNVLEVGSGHGLFLLEVLKVINNKNAIDVIDISPSSIEMTKAIVKSISSELEDRVNFRIMDINDYITDKKYDIVTMGEVIEHVEDPLTILKSLHGLLNDDGRLFVTTCANCPAIDHVYYFANIEEIKQLIFEAGFYVEKELVIPSEDKSEKYLEKFKIDILYAAVLKKRM